MTAASAPIIRSGHPADASALARLRYEFRASQAQAGETEPQFIARATPWMAERLAPGGVWRCWVAEHDGRLVGTVWLQTIEKLPNPVAEPERHGYVSSLYVEPAHRGTGLGGRLLASCLDACAEAALDAVILWPTPRSRSLYERHGFAVRDDLLALRLGSPGWPDDGRYAPAAAPFARVAPER
jgi:GNAT superfamily N-acetyltransferase